MTPKKRSTAIRWALCCALVLTAFVARPAAAQGAPPPPIFGTQACNLSVPGTTAWPPQPESVTTWTCGGVQAQATFHLQFFCTPTTCQVSTQFLVRQRSINIPLGTVVSSAWATRADGSRLCFLNAPQSFDWTPWRLCSNGVPGSLNLSSAWLIRIG